MLTLWELRINVYIYSPHFLWGWGGCGILLHASHQVLWPSIWMYSTVWEFIECQVIFQVTDMIGVTSKWYANTTSSLIATSFMPKSILINFVGSRSHLVDVLQLSTWVPLMTDFQYLLSLMYCYSSYLWYCWLQGIASWLFTVVFRDGVPHVKVINGVYS